MLVTYSYWPHCDPRSTICSIQASSRARSSPVDQALQGGDACLLTHLAVPVA